MSKLAKWFEQTILEYGVFVNFTTHQPQSQYVSDEMFVFSQERPLFPLLFHVHCRFFSNGSCSICCSGVCLTATELADDTFKVGLAPETLRRTYLGELKEGDAVNLERASEIGGRNSGHFVQGHVDGVGVIQDKWVDADSLWVKVEVPDDDSGDNLLRYIVPKGFIAIDGTSLTVVDVNPEEKWFTFMLVEYTQKKIIVPQKVVGSKVNLEVDVLGKYSENALVALLPRLEALEARVESLERQLASQEEV